MPRYKFDDTMYVTIYEMAREGLTKEVIANQLGTTVRALNEWSMTRPGVKDAYRRGRAKFKDKTCHTKFFEYVYDRLPPHLQKLFNQIEQVVDLPAKSGKKRRVDERIQQQPKFARQHMYIHAMIRFNFNSSKASSAINVSLETVKKWMANENFRNLINELEIHKKNFFESALVKLVGDGNTAAILFANRTVNGDRGYAEKQTIQHTGEINVNHQNLIDVDALKLPMEVQLELLRAIRDKKAEGSHNLAQSPVRVLEVKADKVTQA